MVSSGMIRLVGKSVLAFCSICIIFSSLSFYEIYSEEKAILSTLRSRVALVYAGPTFHDEVASVAACILHDLGFFVVVYIGNGVHFGGMMVPFSGRRKRSSQQFYGQCVSQFVTITTPIKYVQDPDIIVFVTYPMMQHAGHVDQYALALLQKIKEDSSSTSVVLITHRTNEMFHSLMSVIENIIPRNQTTYMFLGEHTHNTAKKIVSEYDSDSSIPEIIGNSGKLEISVKSNFTNSGIMDFEGVKIVTVGDPRSFDLSHFYPVVPKEYFMRSKKSLKMREIIENKFKNDNDNNGSNESNSESVNNDNKNDIDSNSNSDGNDSNSEIKINLRTKNQSHQNNDLNDKYSRLKDYQMNLLQTALVKLEKTENEREKKTYHPLFVVQGNFGGKHSHRKDPVGTLNCLRKLEDKLELESVVKQKELKKERRREKLLRNRLNHMRRKTMEENSDFNNTIKFEKINNVRKPKSTESEANDNKPILSINDGNDSCFSPLESSLKSISIDLVGHLNGKVEVGILKTGKVRFLSDLGSKDYYEAISKARFMVASIGEKEYYVSRATSSIPAALIAHVPLVTSGQFLDIYPCLRDAPIHRKMAWGNVRYNGTIVSENGTGLRGMMSNDSIGTNSGNVPKNVPRNVLGNTECEAMEVAVRLTAAEYSQAKEEIAKCSSFFWNQAKESFRSAAEKNKKVKIKKQID